ncbi:MAG: DUF4249 family protein [Rhodothermales bacterium]|nr:DUF4249 family protein [Rhodothermales bacterium]
MLQMLNKNGWAAPAFLLMAMLLPVSGCDSGDPGFHEPEPVVEAWLISGELMPQVRLTWSQSVETRYGSEAVGVVDAQVTISRVDPGVALQRSVSYAPVSSTPEQPGTVETGIYLPVAVEGQLPRVAPGATYELRAEVPGYPVVTSRTTVPGDFDLIGVQNQEVVYQSTEQIEIDVTNSDYPNRDAVYIISIESLEASIENLTPFLRDALYSIGADESFDPSTLDPEELSEVVFQSSPPLNEANWEINADESLTLKMPWFFAAFYGVQEITVSAIDDNVWNHFRYVNAQEGNGGFAPGEIPNVEAGVAQGWGLFGSLTRVKTRVDILRE